MEQQNTKEKIRSFTDILAWKEGHSLVILVYRITETFPKKETYSLVDQMRRASASLTSNIAEGFGRNSYKERIRFYYIAHGSLTELKDQLLIARDVGYLSQQDFKTLADQANTTHALLQGLIKKTKTFLPHTS